MPFTENFPFRRLAVDHLILGGSRIWWQHHRNFNDPFPHVYQLQAGRTGLADATDWVDVGPPATNSYFLTDDQRRLTGKSLLTHYRVILTTPTHQYVSNPVHVFGELPEKDWLLCREIIRKESLSDKFTATDGILLKRLRYGIPCDTCRDFLTNDVSDSRCPECKGVGFKVGYHPPTPFCLSFGPETIPEARGGAEMPGETQYQEMRCRCLAMPAVALEDIWVNARDDRRWAIDTIAYKAQWRGVPLVSELTLRLVPFTDVVYRIPVGGEIDDNPMLSAPGAGSGSMPVTHDYGGEDALAYQDPAGCGIQGASILAFCKATWDGGLRAPGHAVASTTTGANGRWDFALQLDPGDYVLQYLKPGSFGPDTHELSVAGALSAPRLAAPLAMAAPLAVAAPEVGPPPRAAQPDHDLDDDAGFFAAFGKF